jgi:hypothetical protein
MFYPQAYPQFGFNPQQGLNPQGFNPQFNPQQGYGAAGYFNAPTAGIYGAPGIYGGQGLQGQHALQQLLAQPLALQPLFPTPQQFAGQSGFNGNGNNGVSPANWAQAQAQFGPLQQQHPQHQLLLQLAHYHYLVAQQLAQLATQQQLLTQQPGQNVNLGNPTAGQFIPGQQGAYFIPGFTMH